MILFPPPAQVLKAMEEAELDALFASVSAEGDVRAAVQLLSQRPRAPEHAVRKALGLLRDAPDTPQVRYLQAVALALLDDRVGARALLDTLPRDGQALALRHSLDSRDRNDLLWGSAVVASAAVTGLILGFLILRKSK